MAVSLDEVVREGKDDPEDERDRGCNARSEEDGQERPHALDVGKIAAGLRGDLGVTAPLWPVQVRGSVSSAIRCGSPGRLRTMT